MKDVGRDNFGLLIAYLLPGFVVLWGLKPFVPEVQEWLGSSQAGAPTVGGFLFGTLASTGAGMVVSAVRWAVLDRVHHRTGIREPCWDFGKLSHRWQAFEALVEYHYRYYQCYANMLVALVFACGVSLDMQGRLPVQGAIPTLGFLVVFVVLVAGSRDALRKYYRRVDDLQRSTRST